jgi:peptidoglycan hydrolase CwlO-like protein
MHKVMFTRELHFYVRVQLFIFNAHYRLSSLDVNNINNTSNINSTTSNINNTTSNINNTKSIIKNTTSNINNTTSNINNTKSNINRHNV